VTRCERLLERARALREDELGESPYVSVGELARLIPHLSRDAVREAARPFAIRGKKCAVLERGFLVRREHAMQLVEKLKGDQK
jgi:hypothetical protein